MSTETRMENGVVVTRTPEVVTYLQLISQDEKQQEKANLKIKAQEANLELSKKIIEYTQAVEVLKRELDTAKRAVPYNIKAEYDIARKLIEVEALLEYAEEVKNTRFTDALI